MKKYTSYQNTRYDWLPKVPAHWQGTSMRSITLPSSERCGAQNKTLLSVYREYGVIEKSSRDDNHNKESEDLSNYKIVGKNDLVMNKMKMWQGSLGISAYDGIVSPAYIVCHITKDNINHRYLHLLLRSSLFKTYYNRVSYGIRVGQWDMRYDDFKSLEAFLPPREEQDQIVRYLDWQVSKTNKLISALKKQIALLKEQKQAVINEAVTKGLDTRVSMKDSGVEWIGEIPAHWSVLYLFQVAAEQSLSNRTVHNQNLLSLSYGKIKNKDINSTDGLLPASFDTYQIVTNSNIILRLTDLQNDHTSLRVGLATQTGIITSAYTCLLPGVNVLPEYLYLLLHSYDVRKVFYGMGGGVRQSIGYKDIKKLPVLLLSLQEQQNIVTYCFEKQSHIEEYIENIESEISLLGEYRARLISDVVTGQIDVRDVEVLDFEYIADEANDVSYDENPDVEEAEEE